MKIFNDDKKLQDASATFMIKNQDEEQLFKTGMRCILAVYGANEQSISTGAFSTRICQLNRTVVI